MPNRSPPPPPLPIPPPPPPPAGAGRRGGFCTGDPRVRPIGPAPPPQCRAPSPRGARGGPPKPPPPKPAVNSKPHWPSIHATPRRAATWNCSSGHEGRTLLQRCAAFGQLQVSRRSLVCGINRQRRPEHLHSLGKTAPLHE